MSHLGRERFPQAGGTRSGPLTGIRVIDAGTMVAGPFAAVLMADFGADVIKIELPEVGDPGRPGGDGERRLAPILKRGDQKIPLWWKVGARNKRCITLDLSKPEGAEVFKDLVATADILVENYRPGTFERWGVGYEELKQINPKLVMLRISGFGQTGPYGNRAGFGRVAEAMGGLTNLTGEKDGPPMTPGVPLGDLVAGVMGAWAAMTALYHRDTRGGSGQAIDMGLYEAVFRLLEFDAIQYDQVDEHIDAPLQKVHRREGNQLTYVAPSDMLRTRDGKWLTIAASTHAIWLNLCRAMGREDLISNPKFIDNDARCDHRDEINGIVREWVASRTLEEVERILDGHGAAYSTVFDMEDVFQNAQYLAREMLVRTPDPELGEAVVQGVVPKFSETPGGIDHLGPALGAHNEEIYGGELGYSAGRLKALHDAGVI